MNIFVINSGSSSIKYQLIKMPEAEIACSGIVERIGLENAVITHKTFPAGEERITKLMPEMPDHAEGLAQVALLLTDASIGVIKDPAEIEVVGHRVVHGGESFAETTVITREVKAEIKKLFPLAPLHNPSNYLGIDVAEKIFSAAIQVAVFDTAFHQSIPEKAFRFAVPASFYYDHGIRVYGFHGTSHKFVSEQAIAYLGKQDTKIITIHLGNGCSMTAVKNGRSIDTSMGMGPMNGLIMGTRAGDIDQSMIFHLVNQLGYEIEQVHAILNKKSGMLGLTGFSDMRDIRAEMDKGDGAAKLAYDMYAYRIRKYLGAYTAAMNGLDAIVFTGGVGENDVLMRYMCANGLEYLGINLDREKNEAKQSVLREINTSASRVKILVIPTNEEQEIASQCVKLLTSQAIER
ncbi:MAG: acetate kinase [Ferruginibacter sp.]|nr:acetate kinase [Ferruginibacter sp.]